jgi:hypothetical protein
MFVRGEWVARRDTIEESKADNSSVEEEPEPEAGDSVK